jgi:hypothetical protein
MSALPPKADIPQHRLDVRSVPITTECTAANTVTSRGRPTGPTYPIILIWSVAQSGMRGSNVAVWIRAFGELALQYCGP